ncbi:PucR-like helix-turn-helix protein [Herbihabitans rhizosphaerae]|uniref:PucR-like helix-turn-helix protein n=1 Tax=Herbihabitans rhizosphaerae TaxID=1872711 RepID=A0A4Q7KGD4_9PSEU|nr:PucR-like helix-turn-helix protein [Herbihabitans rhizosphaerae]
MPETDTEPTHGSSDQVMIAFDSMLSPPSVPRDPRSVTLWSALPGNLAEVFRPGIPSLTDEILREIQRTIPALAQDASGIVGRSVIDGIQQAIAQFLDRLKDPYAQQGDRAQVFRDFGVRELNGVPILDLLQMAYRVGARVAWRRMAQTGQRAGIPTQTLCLLAEALFVYIDELSALSVEGHATAQAREAGVLERRRRQLLEVILSGRRPAEITRLAKAAQWAVPERVTLVALRNTDADVAEAPAPALDRRILVDLEGDAPCLLLADTDRELLETLDDCLPGWRAAVGPAVPVAEARESLRWALRTVSLVAQGVLPDRPVTLFDEHLSVLWLMNDPFLASEVSKSALAPMRDLTEGQRERLSTTLLAWLETRRSAPEIARILDVHPQTVRYRLRKLEQLFGGALDDPDVRFDIEVALRAQKVAAARVAAQSKAGALRRKSS